MKAAAKPNATPSALKRALHKLDVPRGSVALGWLGQAGFVLKSPAGVRIALDPYLSNSCEEVGRAAGLNMRRLVPSPLAPGDLLDFDALVFTHSHQDHVDPETVAPYLAGGGRGPVIAPHEASDRLRSLGVPAEVIRVTWPNNIQEIGDLSIRATFAIPFAGDDLTHVGYVVAVRDGPTVYFTGDTDYNEILSLSVAPLRPDVMVTVINPAFRNLSPREAARLAKDIGPRWVVPCHHDLFADNSLPDRLLRTNLILQGIAETFCPLEHGILRVFPRRDPKVPGARKAGRGRSAAR
jgi:L-ascorbate 6-phosphate lactonase